MQPTADGIFSLLYTSNAAWNETRWNNAAFDRLVAEARATVDQSRAASSTAQAQKLMYEEVPSIIPVFFDLLAAQRDYVEGYRLHPRGAVFRLDYVWLRRRCATERVRSSPCPLPISHVASWLMVYTLLVVSIIVFGITQILPADAATVMMGENATPEQLAALRDRLGLNDSGVVQYLRWLSGVLTGDFGVSMRTGQPVAAHDPRGFVAVADACGPVHRSDAGRCDPAWHPRGDETRRAGRCPLRLGLLCRRLAAGVRHRDAGHSVARRLAATSAGDRATCL